MAKPLSPFLLLLICSPLLIACAEKRPDASPDSLVSFEHTFAASFDKAWQAALEAVTEITPIKTLDRGAGMIVTESREVESVVSNPLATTFLGWTDRNSYVLTIAEKSFGKTTIAVRSQLVREGLAVAAGARPVEEVEAALRHRLFLRICQVLYQDGIKCAALFPDGNSASCLPPGWEFAAGGESAALSLASSPPPVSKAMVKELQRVLRQKGYRPGPVDGILGRQTRAALLSFQEDNGLAGGGALTEESRLALGLSP